MNQSLKMISIARKLNIAGKQIFGSSAEHPWCKSSKHSMSTARLTALAVNTPEMKRLWVGEGKRKRDGFRSGGEAVQRIEREKHVCFAPKRARTVLNQLTAL